MNNKFQESTELTEKIGQKNPAPSNVQRVSPTLISGGEGDKKNLTTFRCQNRFKEITSKTHPLRPLNSSAYAPRGLCSQIKSNTQQPEKASAFKLLKAYYS